jgi:hypothetical protein
MSTELKKKSFKKSLLCTTVIVLSVCFAQLSLCCQFALHNCHCAVSLLRTTVIVLSTKGMAGDNSNAETDTTLGFSGNGLMELPSTHFITMTHNNDNSQCTHML